MRARVCVTIQKKMDGKRIMYTSKYENARQVPSWFLTVPREVLISSLCENNQVIRNVCLKLTLLETIPREEF